MLAYLHTFSGVAGDMLLGALVDAGLAVERLRAGLGTLAVSGYELTAAKVKRRGFSATKADVKLLPGHDARERHLRDIVNILADSGLSERVRADAERVFTRLAEAEAKVHGTTIDKVHFHEVGAVDAIVDIVGACLGLELLDIDEIVCSPVPVGSGFVKAEHGVMPVPAPAVAELLRDVPLTESAETGELTTPTGAALVATLAHRFGPTPAMKIQSIGYGAGTREGKHGPNVLRVLLGPRVESATGSEAGPSAVRDQVWVLESNIDDLPGEVIGYTFDKLFAAGALDVFAAPIQMKKSRPAVCLSVIAPADKVAEIEAAIFAETSTFGVRRYPAERTKLAREFRRVETPFGPVRIKIGTMNGRVMSRSPEYEDCRKLAEAAGVPLKDVFAAAARAGDGMTG
jgi:hypothetical protein